MPDPEPTGQQLVAIKARRDQTIAVLCEHFAHDRLTVEEFEQRLDVATRAQAVSELEGLLSDLPSLVRQNEPATAQATAPAPGQHHRAQQTLVAIMGGVERRGQWQPAAKTMIIAVMGGAVLDFREVQLPPGETEVTIIAIMGGAEIIVPPEMSIDVSGIAIMGGFTHQHNRPSNAPAGPILKVDGFAMMGGVDVQVRQPGETPTDTRRRLRDERRRLKDEWRKS